MSAHTVYSCAAVPSRRLPHELMSTLIKRVVWKAVKDKQSDNHVDNAKGQDVRPDGSIELCQDSPMIAIVVGQDANGSHFQRAVLVIFPQGGGWQRFVAVHLRTGTGTTRWCGSCGRRIGGCGQVTSSATMLLLLLLTMVMIAGTTAIHRHGTT